MSAPKTSWRLTMTPKEVEHLEAETREDFIDMCIGQAGVSPIHRTDA